MALQLIATHTIIAFSTDGGAVFCPPGADVALDCCDLFGNAEGDWTGGIAGQYGVSGNISADPLFCDPENGDFRLNQGSPCAPDQNPDCGGIGAWPVGCGSTPAEATTWGGIKALFR